MTPYFDDAYFDSAYFATDAAPPAETWSGGYHVRRPQPRLAPVRRPDDFDDILVWFG